MYTHGRTYLDSLFFNECAKSVTLVQSAKCLGAQRTKTTPEKLEYGHAMYRPKKSSSINRLMIILSSMGNFFK
jgi:hypothetical protein